jgi:hypothetical protein
MYANATERNVNKIALDLYRLAWDVADLFVAVNTLRATHTRTADTEAEWDGLGKILSGRAPLTASTLNRGTTRSPGRPG